MSSTFDQYGNQFWDKNGAYRTLHHINPARLEFIERYVNLAGAEVLDVGCGGGILAESLAQKGAIVTGIDISQAVLEAARQRLITHPYSITYQHITLAELAQTQVQYDHLTCMEMLEHITDIGSVLRHCYTLLRPNGYAFFSTLNRTTTAFLGAIVAGEYLTRLIPKGTHNHAQFIKPEELVRMVEVAGFTPIALSGMRYNPLTKNAHLSRNMRINYLLVAQKIGA